MIQTAEDLSRHSTMHISELPLQSVTIDDKDGDVSLTFVHRHRVVQADYPAIEHVEVADTITFRISNAAAQEIVKQLVLPNPEGKVINAHESFPEVFILAGELREWFSEAVGCPERGE